MNDYQLHLAFNHMPVFCLLFAAMAGVWLLWSKNRAALGVMIFLNVLGAGSAVMAVRTGEAIEEKAEKLPDVTEAVLHEHEEAAEFAQIMAIVVGVASLALWVADRKKPQFAKPLTWIVVIGSVVGAAAMFRTAHTGGQVRHTEIRPGN